MLWGSCSLVERQRQREKERETVRQTLRLKQTAVLVPPSPQEKIITIFSDIQATKPIQKLIT